MFLRGDGIGLGKIGAVGFSEKLEHLGTALCRHPKEDYHMNNELCYALHYYCMDKMSHKFSAFSV